MKNRFLLLCDFAAYHRIDVGFLFLALVGIVLVAFGYTYGWLIAIFCLTVFGCAGVFGELDRSEQEAYFARYDLGDAWPHRAQWYRAMFDRFNLEGA